MAQIIEFSVDELAGRSQRLSQTLHEDVNIFFGPNGSGKTSLLRILHSALDREASLLNHTPFHRAEVKLRSGKARYICVLQKTRDEDSAIKQVSVGDAANLSEPSFHAGLEVPRFSTIVKNEWTVTPKQKENYRGWSHSYLPTTRLWIGSKVQRSLGFSRIQTEEELDSYFQSALQQLWSTYMSDILEAVRTAQAEGLANILQWIMSPRNSKGKQSGSMPDVDTAFARVSSFLARQGAQASLGSKETFSKRYAQNKLLKGVVSYIDEVELRIEQAMMPRNKVQELIQKLFSGNKTVRFTDSAIDVITEDKTSIGVANLSSGEKHILRILVEALHAKTNALIIDEPEISMHVDWQKELVAALRMVNPQAQLILATHSPEIMADIDDSKIFRI